MAVVLTLDISWCCAACWKSHQRGTHHKQAIHSPLWAASWGFWVSSCCSSMENQSGMHTWGKNLWARVSRSLSSEIHWHLSVFSPLKRCRVQPQRRFQIYRVAGPMKMTGKDEQMLEIDFQEGLAVSESELCGCDLLQFWEATATSKWRSLLAPRGELSKECQDVKSQQGSRPHKLVESMSHHERTVVNLENSEWTSKSLSRDIQGTFWFSQKAKDLRFWPFWQRQAEQLFRQALSLTLTRRATLGLVQVENIEGFGPLRCVCRWVDECR